MQIGYQTDYQSGYYTCEFDKRVDFDESGCSISLDLDIAELIEGDFYDLTQAISDSSAPVRGIGVVTRLPSSAAKE